MYAIIITMNKEALALHHTDVPADRVDALIREFLTKRGFSWYADAIYAGGPLIDAVSAVLIIQEMAQLLTWFNTRTVSAIRLLRIDEAADLTGVLVDSEIRRALSW
jgi:virulence-associated protein VapD